MKHQIVLPFVNSPVTAFSHQATLLSILFAYEQCKEWICNNYIQLFSLKNLYGDRSGTVDFFYSDYSDFRSYEYSANPWIKFFEFPLKAFWSYDVKLEEFIYKYLQQGFYIQLEIDEYYISKYDNFKKNHYVHWLYIYGIDIDEQQFFCLDNFKNMIFSAEKISYQELYQGFLARYERVLSKNDIGPTVVMFKVMNTCEHKEDNIIYELDIDRIRRLLNSFIGNYKRYNAYESSNYYVYGVEVYNALQRYISATILDNEVIDLRGFCSLEDHKKLMLWRLKFIEEKKKFDLQEDIVNYEKLCKMMRIVILALLKYNITHNTIYLYKASNNLKMVAKIEEKTIVHIIEMLKSEKEFF